MERVPWRAAIAARKAELLCAALLCAMAINLLGQITRKSITNDETVLIPAAYYHLVAGEFHLVFEHPPLCKLLAGLPLLFIQPNELKPEHLVAGKSKADHAWTYQERFWADNRDIFERISFWTRLPMAALTLGLGALVFVFARDVFGVRAALIALALFVVEPTVLAHGRVVQTDIPAAFGFLLTLYATCRYAAEPTGRRAAFIGFAAGVAVLAKFSMLIVAPLLAAFFAVRWWRAPNRKPVLRDVGVLCLTTLIVINAAYFFQHRAITAAEIAHLNESFARMSPLVVPVATALSYIIPAEFVLGILWQVTHSAEGHTAGLLGMYRKTGWWYYFPVAFSLKTTLPFLFLSVASFLWASWRAVVEREKRFLWLVVPLVIYSLFLLFTGINIGVRYYIPGYVLFCVLAGTALARLTTLKRLRFAGIATASLVLASCGFIAVRVYPNYMSYMNAFASRHPHWWYLSDSNIEWGDDVKELVAYLRARGENSVGAALLGGWVTLQYYGMNYVDLLGDEAVPETRYVAIGASFLNGSTVPGSPRRTEDERIHRFDAFRRRVPEAVIGGSTYVFKMRD